MATKWAQKALAKHKGALTRSAKKAKGYSKKTGKIKVSYLRKAAKKPGKTGRRARLALNVRGFKH